MTEICKGYNFPQTTQIFSLEYIFNVFIRNKSESKIYILNGNIDFDYKKVQKQNLVFSGKHKNQLFSHSIRFCRGAEFYPFRTHKLARSKKITPKTISKYVNI